MICDHEKEQLKKRILKYDCYPDSLKTSDYLEYQVLREVVTDIYNGLASGKKLADYKEFIYKPQPSSKAVLNLSTSLYGYYAEENIKLRSELCGQEYFPLFFNIYAIENEKLSYIDTNDIEHRLTVQLAHKPTDENYWHFEFAIYEGQTQILLESKPGSVPKRVSERLLQYLLSDNDCLCAYGKQKKFQNTFFTDILKKNRVSM